MQDEIVLSKSLNRLLTSYADEHCISLNEAINALLGKAVDLQTYGKAVRRKNAHMVAIGLLLFAQENVQATVNGVTARDLYSALHVGSWMDLPSEKRHQIVAYLLDELSDVENEWNLQILKVKGEDSSFCWRS